MLRVGTLCVDRVSPAASFTSPAAGNVSGIITVAVTASDNDKVGSVQFQLDGVNIGGPVTVAPYQVSYDTRAVYNGGHTFSAIVADRVGNTITITRGVNMANLPTVQMTSPSGNIADTTTLYANVNSYDSSVSVQFYIDGSPVGAAQGGNGGHAVNYDTHFLGPGGHTFSCTVTDAHSNQASSSIGANVVNGPPGGGYVDLGSYAVDGNIDRWKYGFYPDFHAEGGSFTANPRNLPGNPNPTYYNMRAYLFVSWMENPVPGSHAYLGLWINRAAPDTGPNVQIEANDSTNNNIQSGYFGVSGGEYIECERWADVNTDPGYTHIVRVYYDFTVKYSS